MASTTEQLLSNIAGIMTSICAALGAGRGFKLQLGIPNTTPLITLSYPFVNKRDMGRFAVFVTLLSEIHYLLSADQTVTKRGLYYQHFPETTQSVVNYAVDRIAAAFGVPRSALGIFAALKGMLKGGVRIALVGGDVVEGIGHGAVLIPADAEVESVQVRKEVERVLLVEKEAVFQRLSLGEKVVVVTGKGYPDLSTRRFLAALSKMGLPVFALVDLDPHGIEIMATVRFGSKAMAHEGSALCVEGLRWLGLRLEDMDRVFQEGGRGILRLTERDRRKAESLLRRPWIGFVPEWESVLQRMLTQGNKAEIEILGGGLEDWVKRLLAES